MTPSAAAPTGEQLKRRLEKTLLERFSLHPLGATDPDMYNALTQVLRDLMRERKVELNAWASSATIDGRTVDAPADVSIGVPPKGQDKQVYYLCMEFLLGRSLKNTLYNLHLTDTAAAVLEGYGFSLDALYELEPDAGLGNGGLGRLAACYLDGLASQGVPVMGYSLLYENGIFRQKLAADGWQTELPDNWLPGGQSWLLQRPELTQQVAFDGQVAERWDGSYHSAAIVNPTVVTAVPYDLMVAGLDGKGIATLRLWQASSPGLDMAFMAKGDYLHAMEQRSMAEVITQILYPPDSTREGKTLRLTQQYFLVSASMQDLVRRHLARFGSLDTLPAHAAIHINDTHPALSVPELMRILLDDCGYQWDKAWELTQACVAYTNHTVMPEALECWDIGLFQQRLPRIFAIVSEIDRRYREGILALGGTAAHAARMGILGNNQARMANLCAAAAHKVNGVSALHSDIIKRDVFPDAAALMPDKFTNVTNGIAHRRWLCQSNPPLTAFIAEHIGAGFVADAAQLENLKPFADDPAAQAAFLDIKKQDKERLAAYIQKTMGMIVPTDALFDVQVKRLHEYKRQHLNALHILYTYLQLKDNPSMDFTPRVYIFGAKAAPGYYLAKQIIRFICTLAKTIDADAAVRDKLRVVYLEDYRVTLAELLMPAADISEQISLAGTEASGTGNMKLMMNGALTLGTLDGANVEIRDNVGEDNMFLFGMNAEQVAAKRREGYRSATLYEQDSNIRCAIDAMKQLYGQTFADLSGSLVNADPFMVLADFEDYRRAQALSAQVYNDKQTWARKALLNVAGSGVFAADRAVKEYCDRIWGIEIRN